FSSRRRHTRFSRDWSSDVCSSDLGLGNIAGVGVAIAIGGPGATFWMILAGLFSMASKFTECLLAVKYRNEYPDGTVSGGPMYYRSEERRVGKEWRSGWVSV